MFDGQIVEAKIGIATAPAVEAAPHGGRQYLIHWLTNIS